MATSITPYIPDYITVHMGTPNDNAENITVSFPDYIKNVASSEIYPTWEPAALRANILAQISFALNRVYTEFYPSRGYPFNITATTAFDQKFVKGRNIFENVEKIVDELFNTYIRRIGFVEPLSAKFCNGTTSTCDGLSQWGSQALAKQGMDSVSILRYYYGDNIELVSNAPITGIQSSYPGQPLRRGATGLYVIRIQVMLNRISRNYPAIPKIPRVDGIFGETTEKAVIKFQQIFNLSADGVVGSATWYKMIYLYVGILDLAELVSQGQTFYSSGTSFQYLKALSEGDTGEPIRLLQYMLSIVSEFHSNVPRVPIDGIFGPATRESIIAVQRMAGLTQDGAVGRLTWGVLYRLYAGITDTVSTYTNVIPLEFRPDLDDNSDTQLTQFSGQTLGLGDADTRGASA